MTAILGISAFYHDSAAVLYVGTEIVATAQEERFTRKKGNLHFSQHTINICLAEGQFESEEFDYVGFYDEPLTECERLLETPSSPLRQPVFGRFVGRCHCSLVC